MKISDSIIKKLFYSKLFHKQRSELYKSAYEQGAFDEKMDRTYRLNKHKEEEEYQ